MAAWLVIGAGGWIESSVTGPRSSTTCCVPGMLERREVRSEGRDGTLVRLNGYRHVQRCRGVHQGIAPWLVPLNRLRSPIPAPDGLHEMRPGAPRVIVRPTTAGPTAETRRIPVRGSDGLRWCSRRSVHLRHSPRSPGGGGDHGAGHGAGRATDMEIQIATGACGGHAGKCSGHGNRGVRASPEVWTPVTQVSSTHQKFS